MPRRVAGRIALVLEYTGTAYAGWQYQVNANAVQAEVEQALLGLFRQVVSIRGASRTDSGVHARGQVATLDLPQPFPADKLIPALNWHLPADVRVVRAYSVPWDFNPCSWAVGKIYRYYIFNRSQRPAIGQQYYWHMSRKLDIDAMNRATQYCRGRHDFSSFQAAGSPVEHTVRTIRHLFCRRQGDVVTVTCIGDGFLYNMVRIIVGTLVETGLGKQNPDWVGKVIVAKDRCVAGPTAPARGLFLERVLYRPSLDSYRRL